jgi:hypothetical protein
MDDVKYKSGAELLSQYFFPGRVSKQHPLDAPSILVRIQATTDIGGRTLGSTIPSWEDYG